MAALLHQSDQLFDRFQGELGARQRQGRNRSVGDVQGKTQAEVLEVDDLDEARPMRRLTDPLDGEAATEQRVGRIDHLDHVRLFRFSDSHLLDGCINLGLLALHCIECNDCNDATNNFALFGARSRA